MPRYIVKVNHPDTGDTLYAEWSTVVDAPVSLFMPLADFKMYYEHKYDTTTLNERLERVEQKGVSAYDYDSPEQLMKHNRASEDDTCLPIDELIRQYTMSEENL